MWKEKIVKIIGIVEMIWFLIVTILLTCVGLNYKYISIGSYGFMLICAVFIGIPLILSIAQIFIKKDMVKKVIVFTLIPVAFVSIGCLGFATLGGLFYSHTNDPHDYGEYDERAGEMLESYNNILPSATDENVEIISYSYSYRETLDDTCNMDLKVKCKNEDTLNELLAPLTAESDDIGVITIGSGFIAYDRSKAEIEYNIVIER